MPKIGIRLNDREYKAVMAIRRGRLWRTVFLEALGIPEDKRKLGRPSGG